MMSLEKARALLTKLMRLLPRRAAGGRCGRVLAWSPSAGASYGPETTIQAVSGTRPHGFPAVQGISAPGQAPGHSMSDVMQWGFGEAAGGSTRRPRSGVARWRGMTPPRVQRCLSVNTAGTLQPEFADSWIHSD